jgi:hypothetical protein
LIRISAIGFGVAWRSMVRQPQRTMKHRKKNAKKENLKGVKNHLKELCLVSFLVTSEITIQNLKTEIPK